MAKRPVPPPGESGPPTEYPQTTPRDLYATSDIRFVMVEVGKLSANVERLIADIKSQGEKLDAVRHQASYIKGGLAVGIVLIGGFIAIASFFLSSKWDAVLQALRAAAK